MDIYTITFKRPHDPRYRIPRNAVRGIAFKAVKGLEATKQAAAEIAQWPNHEIIEIRDYTGKRVTF